MPAFPRPMTADERAVLLRLLSEDFEGADELRAQAETAQVTGRCDCPCPTFYIQVAKQAPRAKIAGPLAPVELTVQPEETGDHIILFVTDGLMTSLEYVWFESPPPSWPSPSMLSVSP